jgi:hypothetical protein
MGDYFDIIVDEEATEDEAPVLAASVVEWLISEGIIGSEMTDNVLGSDLGYPPGPNNEKAGGDKVPHLWTNGMHVITGRTVFHPMQGEVSLICSECGERLQWSDEWSDAVGEWYDRKGQGLLACVRCGHTKPITEWRHDPPWAFGNLGFQFWNWPPLTESFIELVSQRLGHKVVHVYGKL